MHPNPLKRLSLAKAKSEEIEEIEEEIEDPVAPGRKIKVKVKVKKKKHSGRR